MDPTTKTFKHESYADFVWGESVECTLEAIGGTAVYLASDAGACTSGEIIHVDGGYHVLGMPQAENL